MYFKIEKKSELHATLVKVKADMKAANKAAFALANELGFEKYRPINNFTIAGGIMSLYSEDGKKPDGYAYTYGSSSPNDVFPKRKLKANKELLAKIDALPTIPAERLNGPIKYDWRKHKSPRADSRGGSQILFTPGVSFAKNDEILISFPDYITSYKPVKGMIEITFTEHKTLNK